MLINISNSNHLLEGIIGAFYAVLNTFYHFLIFLSFAFVCVVLYCIVLVSEAFVTNKLHHLPFLLMTVIYYFCKPNVGQISIVTTEKWTKMIAVKVK